MECTLFNLTFLYTHVHLTKQESKVSPGKEFLNYFNSEVAVRGPEIQYDLAQKLTFLKLKRMRDGTVCVLACVCVFFRVRAALLRVDNHMYLCSLPSHERCYIRKRCSNQTHGRVQPAPACRERKISEIPPPATIMLYYMYLGEQTELRERSRGKNTHLKTFAPLLRATSVTSGDLLYL